MSSIRREMLRDYSPVVVIENASENNIPALSWDDISGAHLFLWIHFSEHFINPGCVNDNCLASDRIHIFVLNSAYKPGTQTGTDHNCIRGDQLWGRC